jgi:hypothetical protein
MCIEARAVVADRGNSRCRPWSVDPEVMIHESDMRVHVDRQNLVFRFGVEDEDWTADEEGLETRHVRAAMVYEEHTAAARSRMELSLESASTRTTISTET